MCKHGNASGWDSSYGERMHKYFFTSLGHNTQRRHALFATQLANRRFESFTIDKAVNHSSGDLMDIGEDDEVCAQEVHDGCQDVTLDPREYNYNDEDIPRYPDFKGRGKFWLENISTTHDEYDLTWKDRDAHDSKKKP